LHAHENGKNKSPSLLDKEGLVDFSIANFYLVSFAMEYDDDPRIGEVLFMLGDIRSHSIFEKDNWIQNFYFKEVIRRFPHTPLALKAFQQFQADIEFGYTGSSGTYIPRSEKEMLERYRKMAVIPGKHEK